MSRRFPGSLRVSGAAIDLLVSALDEAFREGATGARIAELLGTYAAEHEDWRPFALFDDKGYTRNLIARSERFELLLLCWGARQESPIHNHEGQDCWMGVLDGRIEELRYVTPEEVRPGPLNPREAKTFEPGQVAFIRDEIGLHVVRPAESGQAAVSLHLYALPYSECNCYCPDTGRITRKRLAEYSVRGKLVAAGA